MAAMEGAAFWSSLFSPGNHPSSSSSSSSSFSSFSFPLTVKGSNLCLGGDEDTWEYFLCPFCYVEIEFPVLCSHLLEEHCFDTKDAVCPLCAANGGKDMTAHFLVHHSQLLKRRKSRRTSWQAGSSASFENEQHELDSYLEEGFANRKKIIPDSAPDLLLLSFISTPAFPISKDEGEANNESFASFTSIPSEKQCSVRSTCEEAMAEDHEEKNRRVAFMQQLVFSTIFEFESSLP
ncbi:Protein dehydration-induced 19 like 5 [Apostasia shenzhenica]|uniref:Protein dehydration-induced 19 like 5 n=1 Tax=Apostasia shenzhenica TaxID=1088818 RepID=A0A2I0AQH8_9ASPA|nr:Protein dehydration-induced 19 like 5 [Apostasia shenzhenica]